MDKKLGDPTFRASIGCIDKFKFRHCIQQLDISGVYLSANSEEKSSIRFYDPKGSNH